jgi:hypothetical protein
MSSYADQHKNLPACGRQGIGGFGFALIHLLDWIYLIAERLS